MGRLNAFLAKSTQEKYESVRFRWMKLLAGLPYCPARYRMSVGAGESVGFWWSSVFMSFVPQKPMFEYCGSDVTYLRLLWRLLGPGMVFLDVGAFHGLYTTIAARRTAPTGRVIAFEPSRRDRRRLTLHVAMNRLANVRVEPYAVSVSAGVSEFYVVRHGFTTMNSLRPPATVYPVDRTVAPTISLDEYCLSRGVRRVDCLKVDVEGGELDLFRGASALLKDVRPLVLCEVLDWVTRPWGYEARLTVRHLSEHGYEWFEVGDGGGLRAHREQESYPEVKNYLAVPEERREAVARLVTP
jgi:FkbM family methyltransferase